MCRLTGNPDAKTRATAIQALTEMGERGACFEEEVDCNGKGGCDMGEKGRLYRYQHKNREETPFF